MNLPANDPASASPPRKLPEALSSLENPEFRWLFASNMAYFLSMMGQFALRAILAWQLTQSPLALSYISLAIGIPMLLFAPFGGVIADRVERRNLIIAGQSLILAAELSIFALLALDILEFWHLLAATGLMGCAFPAISSARQAIVANIVGRQRLGNAMALSMGGLNLSRVLGPAMAGVLIPVIGLLATYFLGIALYSIGLISMFGVKRHPHPSGHKPGSPMHEIMEGIRYIKNHVPLRATLLIGLLPTCIAFPFQSLLVIFAEEIWMTGTEGFGYLQATFGLGGVAATFIVAHRGSSNTRTKIMFFSLAAMGIFLAGFAYSPKFYLGLVLLFIASLCGNLFLTLNNIVVQLLVDDKVRGRVSSVLLMSISLTSLGTVPLASLAASRGAPFAVAASGVCLMVLTLGCFAASKTLRGMDDVVRNHVNPVSPP
jgi:predicted MFS family arabinose efflux permease